MSKSMTRNEAPASTSYTLSSATSREATATVWTALKRLTPLMADEKRTLALVLLAIIVSTASALLAPIIISRAIEEPIRMIVQNAGGEGSIVVEKVRSSKDDAFGYNALTDTYENLVQAGVIDPTKVTRTALQNAASIAGLLLTTEALIVEKKEKEAPHAGPPGGGMGGMY